MYPDPPSLSAYVAPGMDTSEALLASCETLYELGCEFSGDVLATSDHGWFEYVTDVEREIIHCSGSPREIAVDKVLLRVGFRHRKWGKVVLGRSPARRHGERHPLEVTIHAGPLSFPVELWGRTERREAGRITSWMERLLLTLAGPTRALYGAIGVEARFPSRARLRAAAQGGEGRPYTWFWPPHLGERATSDEAELLSSLDESAITHTRQGILFRAWRPPTDVIGDERAIDRVLDFLDRTVDSM